MVCVISTSTMCGILPETVFRSCVTNITSHVHDLLSVIHMLVNKVDYAFQEQTTILRTSPHNIRRLASS